MIRSLRPDEPRPDGEPRRYPDSAGYVRLRWKVGPNSYVEIREHRLVVDAPDDRQVHHLDRDRANNHPDNLLLVTPEEHSAIHAEQHRKVNVPLALTLYRGGMSTTQIASLMGVDHSNVYRCLAPQGVLRDEREAGRLRRVVTNDARVLALHQLGLNAGQIARLIGVGPDAIRGALGRHGITGRSGRPTRAMVELEERLRAA